jgi:hypothetical protein
MGFLFGMFVGVMLFGDGNTSRLPPGLGEIPFRCFAAIEQSDSSYRDCRRRSMRAQISEQMTAGGGINYDLREHETDAALDYEITALHDLEAAAKAQHKVTAP